MSHGSGWRSSFKACESASDRAIECSALKAVILAAGYGKRLRPFTRRRPKPLLPVFGRPLLEHVICTLKQAGVENFVIVTGYLGRAIRSHFGDGATLDVKIQYAHNPAYDHGNGTSLGVVEEFVEEDEAFLLSMADHLIDVSIVEEAVRNLKRQPLLCVDRKPRFLRRTTDATKVFVGAESYVKDIDKNLLYWNGIDTGLFLLNSSIFEVIKAMKGEANQVILSCCITRLIEGHPLWACDVSEAFWLDIDTWEDLAFARMVGKP